jgi:hypothetical protein
VAAGFSTVESLLPQVAAARRLLDEVRPALVVCADSPALLLAAFGSVATVVIGDGFGVPPADGAEFPALMPNRQPVMSEAKLLRVIKQVQQQLGLAAPESLPGIFAASTCFVTALAELDPYIGERSMPVLGPLELLPAASPPPSSPRFLADLRSDAPDIDILLTAIAQTKIPSIVYLQGASTEERVRWQNAGLEMLEHPPRMHEVIPHVSAFVHHGHTASAQYALAAGRPQFLIPRQMDELLTSQLLHGRGAGNYVLGCQSKDIYLAELQLILTPNFMRQASEAAFSVHAKARAGGLPRILQRCLSVLRDAKSPAPFFREEEENALVQHS